MLLLLACLLPGVDTFHLGDDLGDQQLRLLDQFGVAGSRRAEDELRDAGGDEFLDAGEDGAGVADGCFGLQCICAVRS